MRRIAVCIVDMFFLMKNHNAISDLTGEYFSKLKALIEETFAINDNMPIVLVCHSLGCPYSNIFLNQQPQNWKDKYLRVWLTISSPWGGSVKTLGLYASGYTLGVPRVLVNPLKLRSFQRSIKSSVYLLPSKDFWTPDHVSKISEHTLSHALIIFLYLIHNLHD